jgi:hypothetical protein
MKKKKEYLKEEIFLLRKLAERSTTRFSENTIYSYNSGVADLKDLLEAEYIRLCPIVDKGDTKKYYKIGIKGWELLEKISDEKRRKKNEKVQLWLTIIVILIGLITLTLQFLK